VNPVSIAICAVLLSAAASPEASLRVMTFNLKYASESGPNSWPDRRPVMRECIALAAPDVIGTQEGLYQQLKDIEQDHPEYAWIGLGREGGSHGEFMAVFYRKSRLDPLEFDHFWLSDTPDVVNSRTWGNQTTRMVTWVRFLDRYTGKQFYLVNTHLDNAVQVAREKGAELIAKRLQKLDQSLPLILTGDFNAPAKANKAYDILMDAGFTDAWFSAPKRLGENYGTWHGYNPPTKDAPHIDWILTRGPVTTDTAEVVAFHKGSQYPSDHFPVAVQLRFTGAGQGELP
jgi:endonuclease/exonuclease/phosphatase family metal-dependent hydrolase